jgi:tetratricopeptide (TPR) repeat protein
MPPREPESAPSPVAQELGRIAEILARGGEGEAAGITREQLEALYAMGQELLAAGEFADAVTVFVRICLRDHRSRRCWMGLGSSLQGAGNLEKAIDAYGMAGLCGEPDDPEPFYRIALCHLKLQRAEAASQFLDIIARTGGTGGATRTAFQRKIARLRKSLAFRGQSSEDRGQRTEDSNSCGREAPGN